MLAWQRAGLPVANHTFSHLDLGRVSATEFIADIARNEPDVERFGSGVRYFRDDVLSAYRAVGVSFVSLDAAAADPAYATDPGVVGDGRRTFLAQIADRRGFEIPPDVAGPPVEELLYRCR